MAKKKKQKVTKKTSKKNQRRSGKRGFTAFLSCLIVFAALAACARFVLFTTVKVGSDAMYPDFKQGDVAVVSKLPVWKGTAFTYGDTVYASFGRTGAALIRTVAGLPGDYLEKRDDGITLIKQDGEEVALGECPMLVNGTIPGGAYLLISNDGTDDSRTLGLVSKADITGEAAAVIWPINRIGSR